MPPKHLILGGRSGQGVVDVDSVTGGLVAISEIHRMIHRGLMFTAGVFDDSVPNNGALELFVVTAVGQSAHARFEAGGEGSARLQLFEGATSPSSGTPVTAVNRNRLSTRTPSTLVFYAPAVSDVGVSIWDNYVPGGHGNQAAGGAAESFNEYVLKMGTNYLLRITNISGQANPFSAAINFYEPGA